MEISDFLRARRALVSPEEAGVPVYGRRRVPGLRREEVAQLAGVSVDYYVRLEQGRGRNVSDAVLDAVARVLRLDGVETAHFKGLVRPKATASIAPQEVRPGVRAYLDSTARPAHLLGRRMDLLAWNAAADAVNGFSALPVPTVPMPNMARQVFLNPETRDFYPDWDEVAAETVAYLRLDAGRHPGDPLMDALVTDLSASPAFERLWGAHLVAEKTFGRKRLRHPRVGLMEFGYETLALPGDADQLVVAYTVPEGSDTASKLAALLT